MSSCVLLQNLDVNSKITLKIVILFLILAEQLATRSTQFLLTADAHFSSTELCTGLFLQIKRLICTFAYMNLWAQFATCVLLCFPSVVGRVKGESKTSVLYRYSKLSYTQTFFVFIMLFKYIFWGKNLSFFFPLEVPTPCFFPSCVIILPPLGYTKNWEQLKYYFISLQSLILVLLFTSIMQLPWSD